MTGSRRHVERLAERLRIKTVPREDVTDARTVPLANGRLQIEYNPGRPRQRVRFSIAHELAHTLFPDCGERIRYRAAGKACPRNEWELELLCNLGAAELLMPTGSLPDLREKGLTLEGLLEIRKKFEVSAESVALRYINSTQHPAAMFVSSRVSDRTGSRYRVDYRLSSRAWEVPLEKGSLLPSGSVVEECTAIAHIAKRSEKWARCDDDLYVEVLGLPPYSGSAFPRVLGLVYPRSLPSRQFAPRIEYVVGDATKLIGPGNKIIALIVNDNTPNWGAGFGRAVREKWPTVQQEFRYWAQQDRSNLSLGSVFTSSVSKDLLVAPMVCQHGYGPSEKPRIRYAALSESLSRLANLARDRAASVHMPRIGSGYAGGSWGLVEQLIDENLCRRGVFVTVYDLPSRTADDLRLFDRIR